MTEHLNRRHWLQSAGSLALGTLVAAPSVCRVLAEVPQVDAAVASGKSFAAATVNAYATEAAMTMFAQGGNAADAAVAAALMLAVVDGHNSGIGGGCFVLARSAAGELIAIDGREMAPAAAHSKMFFRDGKAAPELSQTGPLAAGVPGHLAALHQLSQRLGTGLWQAAAELAADRAEEGFALSIPSARRLQSVAAQLALFPASQQIFIRKDGRPLQAGDPLVQHDLAKTLREVASDGPEAFYRGRFADLTSRWMQQHGGLITAEDFANYHTVDRQPIRSSFRGYDVIGFPPPSSGGIHVAQILHYLERFDLKSIANESPAIYFHLVCEAMRLAFADRAVYLGDPDFIAVPRGLLDEQYLRERSGLISTNKRIADVQAGLPPQATTNIFSRDNRHTTHLTTADADGNWIAITATINTTYGSKVVIPETGVVLNNEMDDFAIAPGVPNAFGLVGTEANAPSAGKRPLSSMSPTIALRGGQPIATCGAAGGPRIISASAQIMLNHLALDMPIEKAIAAPRIHHQWRPDKLLLEPAIDTTTAERLESLGHEIERVDAVATAQALAADAAGKLTATAEPRLPGATAKGS